MLLNTSCTGKLRKILRLHYNEAAQTYMYHPSRKKSATKLHQENISVKYIPLIPPLLYSKTGVCRGIPIFLIFDPKHRLWVLVRTGEGF